MAKKLSSAPTEAQPASRAPETPAATNGEAAPKGAPPVWKKRLFSSGSVIDCAVFRTDVDRGQSSFTAYSVALGQSYKDNDGTWHETRSLRRDDLLVAAHVLQRAYAWISEHDQT